MTSISQRPIEFSAKKGKCKIASENVIYVIAVHFPIGLYPTSLIYFTFFFQKKIFFTFMNHNRNGPEYVVVIYAMMIIVINNNFSFI